MEMVPYFQNGSPPVENGEAFLRVRVADDVDPNGSLIVYLPSGTALKVRAPDLLRLKRA